jgi:anaerobic selenocysteine-containing dehydrogenase
VTLRTGPKGSGQFRRISWDAALDRIAAEFKAIVDDYVRSHYSARAETSAGA